MRQHDLTIGRSMSRRAALAALGTFGAIAGVVTVAAAGTDGDRIESITVPTTAPVTAPLLPSTTLAPATTTAPATTAAPPVSEPPPAEMAPRPTEPPPAEAPAAARRAPAPRAAAPVPAPAPAAAPAPAPTPTPTPAADTAAPAEAPNCVVSLHGKGGSGRATTTSGGVVRLAPTGNSSGWGGRQWMYFPESGYQAAAGIVGSAIDQAGCGRVIVGGFSNGGAFASKLYCRGETFGGRLVGVVVDDPVVDNAVNGCAPASGVAITLYWTGALAERAQPGWSCAEADWTCEGGTTIGIDAYAAALGTTARRSPMGGHSPYTNAPELTRF